MDEPVVIALFRHGVTNYNKRKAYCGWTDVPLLYKHQFQPLTQEFDTCFSSDLTRCIQTVNSLLPDATPMLLEELREIHFGQWEGKTYLELKDDWLYQNWLSNPTNCSPPTGESFRGFTDRIDTGWAKIMDHLFQFQKKRVAIVTHGGVLRYLLSKFAPVPKTFWEWHTPHEKVYELTFDRETLRRGEQCTLLQEVRLTENANG